MSFIKAGVMLSTYNGEKYIVDQIDSIFSQDNADVTLYVRDDMSTDKTMEIINDYIDRGYSIRIIESNINVGPAESFMKLIESIPYDYDIYLLADQDDVWLPDKILCSYESIKDCSETHKGVLYCSNQYLFIDGANRGLRYEIDPQHDLVATLFANHIAGCTMAFDNDLLHELKNAKYDSDVLRIRMHDTWIMLVANVCGYVLYDRSSRILYRIHERNTVGIYDGTWLNRVKTMMKRMQNKKIMNGRSKTAKALLDSGLSISQEDEVLLGALANYRNSFKEKLKLMNNERLRNYCPENRFIMCFKIMINWM